MTHFITAVVIPKKGDEEENIAQILAPYDENTKVPEYYRDCSCGDSEKRYIVRLATEGKLKTNIDDLRKSFHNRDDVKRLSHENDEEKLDKMWNDHLADYKKAEAEIEKRVKAIPEQECSDCHGTGVYKTTYNPKSRWDWYAIGGRWDEVIPQNIVPIEKFLKLWGDGWTKIYTRDGKPLTEKNRREISSPPPVIITPKEGWVEQKRYGWFGVVIEETMDDEQWSKRFNDIVKKYPQHLVALVDCHI